MKIPLYFASVSVEGNKSKQHILFGAGMLVRRSNSITRSEIFDNINSIFVFVSDKT